MTDLCLTVGEVQSILESLNVNKATGPDGIPALLLNETTSVIAPCLCKLFNKSLSTGTVLQEWKQHRPQGFSLKKWVGQEKALTSAGHVYSLNIPEKLIYKQPAGFALTGGRNNGK